MRRGATGADIVTALIGLVGRSRRRYGGYIVHVGIVLMFLGFAGEGFKQEEQVLLKPGQQVTVAHFTVRHDALRITSDAQKQMVTGHVSVFDDGKPVATMRPARWFFSKRESDPTTEVAIRRGVGEDLYIVLAGYDAASQSATYAVTVNPLVNWIWFGFGIMALGTGIALLPERAFAFAAAKLPAGAATAAADPAAAAAAPGACAARRESAGHARRATQRHSSASCSGEIICMCGTCGRKRIGECTCSMAAEPCATKSPGWWARGRRASRSTSTTSPNTAARSRWRRRSTRDSTDSRGWCPYLAGS